MKTNKAAITGEGNAPRVEQWQAEAFRSRLAQVTAQRDELEAFLRDALAFIQWAADQPKSSILIATTLAHDIAGLVNQERCFEARVAGYAKKIQEEVA